MTADQRLEVARAAFARRDWAVARERFCAAGDLPTDDLGRLAAACWWLGLPEENVAANEEVHRRRLREGAPAQAALAALEIGFCELLRGQDASAAGWMARARRLFDGLPDAPERGYLWAVDADQAIAAGDLESAERVAADVLRLGDRHEDPTLQAQGLFLCGVVAIRRGRVPEGLRRLDEAMLPVRAGQVLPEWAGSLYCRMIQLCHELADVRRAQHWTDVTEQWCRGHGPTALFTHACRVHRVQLMHLSGDWERAATEVQRAAADLAGRDTVVVAEAHYLLGDVRRLQGDLDGAGRAYRRTHELGRDPLPGLALLHLARGRGQVAASALEAALAAETTPLLRAPLLAGRAEVALATHDVRRARACAEELTGIARRHQSPGWRAEALRWQGATSLAGGRPAAAVHELREAGRWWQQVGAPYRVSRIRLDLADAYDALGDHDTADRERAGALLVLERLGAHRDLERARGRRRGRRTPGGLSEREREVVAAIATGGTNRDAADRLHISERTVARHLANVYLKAGVSTRTAAVAWARDRGLV